jgi:hypothetical protein
MCYVPWLFKLEDCSISSIYSEDDCSVFGTYFLRNLKINYVGDVAIQKAVSAA